MRLVTWNCRGGFARKEAAIAARRPDVVVVPEAEESHGPNRHWVGSNPRKGLGIVSYGDYSLRIHDAYEPRHRWIVPVVVDGPASFILFAVWAMPDERTRHYIDCLLEGVDTYRELLQSPRVVWAGDFNNNVIFDKPRSTPTFASLLDRLEGLGLRSLYHLRRECAHGAEHQNTFYLYHHLGKGYHIDFVFATEELYRGGFDVSVGRHSTWSRMSDHMPLTCTIDGARGECDTPPPRLSRLQP